MKYVRSQTCECKDYPDIDKIPLAERIKTNHYFKDGYCYDGEKCFECSCHKAWRGMSRYDIFAKGCDLPTLDQLQTLQYKGEGDSYNKLKVLPEKLFAHPEYLNTIIHVRGPEGCQKTTSCAKVMFNCLKNNRTVAFVDFNSLAKTMLDLQYDDSELREVDLLILDNCFSCETINFKSTYNAIFDIVIKRKKPTILISSKDLESVLKSPHHYDTEVLESIKSRIERRNSAIDFNDNIDNILLKEKGPIDLWSL